MTPIDIKKLYGGKYKFALDREAMESPRDRSPWLYVIPTRVGEVYPHSDKLLAITCDGHPKIAAELSRRGLRLSQDGDREKTFVCTTEQFETVTSLIRPRRRRKLSDAERDRLVRATSARRFGRT